MTTTKTASLDVQAVRTQFPALSGSQQVYMDNAGGSQVLKSVVSSISDYLLSNNVQLGASYAIAQKSTSLFNQGHEAGAKYINAQASEVVFGSSTTQLFRNLSTSLKFEPGCEIVLSSVDHEANLASWVQVAKWKGLTVKWWIPSRNTTTNPVLESEDLKNLISDKTKLVCCTHTSNILGGITDIASIAKTIKQCNPKTLFCVDAVAYAPHGPVDVKALGVDFYSFSWYKVYGPHIAILYASSAAQQEMESLGHFFKEGATLEEKLGLAGASYEAVQSVPEIVKYIDNVGWDAIARQEEEIQEVLLKYLRSKPNDVKIYGEPTANRALRVPVISFRVRGKSSLSIIDEIEKRSNFACRNGHFYSKRLVTDVLGIQDPDDGVVRCSLVHYNTAEEVQGLVKILDEILSESGGTAQVDRDRAEIANW